ncbi:MULTISPECIES: putative lipid II flippase FtsW [Thiorhodovibrio]|uniref:putative lipid II flippase FtsW n=1 Tax=Thiorhodovibrio TaxID=61593 RepID=UPI0019138961|nr:MULTISPECIES: putative lipid II flippase FtsW [Thiorhodovibrio]MBK5968231.1 putative lipid II flippase FtsW [Thiorhodovibrio winogradskyi]WPL14785.1 Cell division protein FtsW [Thiorhodovibrio litoralis]
MTGATTAANSAAALVPLERMPRMPRSWHKRVGTTLAPLDYPLALALVFLLGLGFVMVASASMPIGAQAPHFEPLYYLYRHVIALAMGAAAGFVCWCLPIAFWQRAGLWLLLGGMVLLLLVLVPGIGYSVNGATRWIRLAGFNLQPSELVKLFTVVYLAGFLVRRPLSGDLSVRDVVRPMLLIGGAGALVMAQPDFGTAAVLLATVLGLLFLGGAPMVHFLVLIALVLAALVALVVFEPYRLERVTSFMNPFADPFNSGYQLSQALIALGRGEWFGVGLGNGIQKQYFLPEAHTDFLLAVIGEELGFVGFAAVMAALGFVTWRALAIGARAREMGEDFSAYIAHGIGLLIGIQAFVNSGVNTGLLPTKGLTLPFMSYGSNSIVVAMMSAALLLRVDAELRRKLQEPNPTGGVQWHRG